MIEHVKIYDPSGKLVHELTVGVGGVKQAFFDQKDFDTLVILMQDNIVTYRGFLYICLKAYKEKSE